MLNQRLGVSAFCWLSLPHLVWSPTPSGILRAPSAGWWLSLPHLVSNSSDLQLVCTPTHWLPVSPSYIIVQSPTQSPLNLWNGMFDRHQAEIIVMQFTGPSLPVHQSMSVSWDFYLVPFRQPNPPTRFLSITGHWNLSLPSGASLWNSMFCRVEGQYTTVEWLLNPEIKWNFERYIGLFCSFLQ